LLEIFAEFPRVRGTFFVLGKFADKYPHVVEEIHQAGHNIGSHGWGHICLFHLSKDEFREDINRSTESIANIIGQRPIGYRAPDFSIVGETLWALEILAEEGYTYDSSIFPISKARYGIIGWPREAVQVRLKTGNTITEFPLATLDLFRCCLPVGGGGYARLLPGFVLVRALRMVQAQSGSPPVFYCHPYEIDPQEFARLEFKIPFKVRLHQGIGRKRTADKLRRLLKNFECISLSEAMTRCENLAVIDYGPYTLDPDSVVRPPAFEGGATITND
jgi:polysaccharide deacetylase family protein (PEP-CTERM system associated)